MECIYTVENTCDLTQNFWRIVPVLLFITEEMFPEKKKQNFFIVEENILASDGVIHVIDAVVWHMWEKLLLLDGVHIYSGKHFVIVSTALRAVL